jgi:hypothetical protein
MRVDCVLNLDIEKNAGRTRVTHTRVAAILMNAPVLVDCNYLHTAFYFIVFYGAGVPREGCFIASEGALVLSAH